MSVRSFILLGQYGFDLGMTDLVPYLSPFGTVTVHQWYDNTPIDVIDGFNGKVAVIGYSLGANQLGWIGAHVNRVIDLGVGYDPSRKSPLATFTNGEWVERAPRYKTLICYYNPSTWYFGGARYDAGITVQIKAMHFGVPRTPGLHERTIEEVTKLANV